MGWWGLVSRAGAWWGKRHRHTVHADSHQHLFSGPMSHPNYGATCRVHVPNLSRFGGCTCSSLVYGLFCSAELTVTSPLLRISPRMYCQFSFTAVPSPVLIDLWVYVFLILSLALCLGLGPGKRKMCVLYLPCLTKIPFCLPEFYFIYF